MELAIKAAGDNGRIQKIIIFVVIATASLTLVLSASFAYLTKTPEFLCRRHNDFNPSFQSCVFSSSLCASTKFDIQKDRDKSVYNFAYSFDLYCNKAFYVPMLSTVFFFGGILGCVMLNSIPDKYGRKNIFKILVFLSCLLQLNLFLTIGPVHLVIVHFLSGFSSFAYGMSSVIVSEYSPRNIAGIVMSVVNAVYPLTGIVVGVYFMFINNWRLLFFLTSVLNTVVTLFTLKYFVESPRWLNSQKKTDECLETLRSIAETNGRVKEWEEFLATNKNALLNDGPKQNSNSAKNYSLIQIIGFKSQRTNFIFNSFLWLSGGFCFYGIILNLGHMGGDFFADSILAFTGEITSELSSGWMAEIFGRVFVMQSGAFLGATCFLVYISTPVTYFWMRSFFIFFATFGYAALFNVVFIYTPELFPTPIRGTVCGFSYLISRLGAMIVSPLTEAFGPSKANFIFILFGYLMGVCCFYMEETLGKEIQDEIPEATGNTSFVVSGTFKSSDVKYDVVVSDPNLDKNLSYSKYFNK